MLLLREILVHPHNLLLAWLGVTQILCLGMLHLFLPVVQAEAGIVHVGAGDEVDHGDAVPDRELRDCPQRVCIGGKLCALEEDGPDTPVTLEGVGHLFHNRRLHLLGRLAHVDITDAYDAEARGLHVETAVLEELALLHAKRLGVFGHDEDLLLGFQGAGDGRTLHHGGHQGGNFGDLARPVLEGHHEAAVPSDRRAAFAF
mmetsp:Transcript_155302/g.289704  ORF Transcript_155302/g.289704 Transcript_155302/m.289704 type:complete len:201 (+) Transcript_155302:845-1447(+)